MEYSSDNQTVELKIKTICCPSYQRRLRRKIFKIDGVQSVSIDAEENLLTVTGSMDPKFLVQAVSDSGKVAEVVRPRKSNHHYRSHDTAGEEHRCEEYDPVPFDDRFCRDFYCTDHRQMGMFRNSAPEDAQFHHHFPPYMSANQYTLPWPMRDPSFQQHCTRPGAYDPHGYGGNCSMM